MPRERTLRGAAAAIALIGVGVATYITIADSGGGHPLCVAGGSGCQTVADSSYSHLFGVNVAVFGIVGYVLLLAAALTPGDTGRFSGLLLSLVGFGFSAYLTYLELFTIDAICQWCVASAILMTLLLVVNLARAIAFTGSEIGAVTPTAGPDTRRGGRAADGLA
jgi:uncharacterized membrane protein